MGGQAKLFGCSEMEVDKRIIEAGGSLLIFSLPNLFYPFFRGTISALIYLPLVLLTSQKNPGEERRWKILPAKGSWEREP